MVAARSTKTTEKFYTLLSADVSSIDTAIPSIKTTFYYYDSIKDAAISPKKLSSNYRANRDLVVSFGGHEQDFYGKAKDSFFDKLLALETAKETSAVNTKKDNEKFQTLLNAYVAYLRYARLYGYEKANNNTIIVDSLNQLIGMVK